MSSIKFAQEAPINKHFPFSATPPSRLGQGGTPALAAATPELQASDDRKVERILATARALLAVSLLATLYLGHAGFSPLSLVVLPAYCAYSIFVLLVQRMTEMPIRIMRLATHVGDILWAGALMLIFSGSIYSPFVVFLIFPLLAAAMRWGFRATIATTIMTIAVLFLVLWFTGPPLIYDQQQVEAADQNRFSLGTISLLILGFLLAYLGQHEKQLRVDAIAAARIANQTHQATTPNDTIAVVFDELFQMFAPAQVQLAIHEIPTGRIHVWESSMAATGRRGKLLWRDLDFTRREDLLFQGARYHLFGTRSAGSGDGSFDIHAFDAAGVPISKPQYKLDNESFPERFGSFTSVPLIFGSEWETRLFLWDPLQGKVSRSTLRAVTDATNRLSSTIFAAALQQHLRSRATAEERSRVARELHDGIMQSLVGLDMKMEVVKKICTRESYPILKEVTSIQQVLRSEVLGLRELIQHSRHLDLGPTQLVPFLSETVSRFQRESNIVARFICELEEAHLPASTCYEVARIVQEALTNVRKHSGATNVIVRFARHLDQWVLVLTDDGRGFDFVGRCTLDDLDAARKGPAVIKERLRSIGGDMIIESAPNRGARIEITFPTEGK
jgi:signal transduction histidine kinase